ncbi:Thiopurine S-methyltransferase [BD1-7 clade bacterium]|uniref:Thiopurine S-methyltransferase n=1 Tax=BD1-7 clade bacterium TaxID=2029982 RepID=A0A5S9MYX0_9GAMM|nr:Thiopurine S-methyltransferase [BD1-7 clade bacterium]
MKADFWHQRWENKETGWHEASANPVFTDTFHHLGLTTGDRVFVPMCGKTLDIHWLLDNGYAVVGAELNEPAVQQLFTELGKKPRISDSGTHKCYEAENITVWVGDILTLSTEQLGQVDGIYDRGALVALPKEMRSRYAPHIKAISQCAPQLLVTYRYDTQKMQGPPFAIAEAELEAHYDNTHQRVEVFSRTVDGKFAPEVTVVERVWLLAEK